MLFYVVDVLSAFGLSSACYDVMLFVVLLHRFIDVGVIQTCKTNLISQIYQIMLRIEVVDIIVTILSNLYTLYQFIMILI